MIEDNRVSLQILVDIDSLGFRWRLVKLFVIRLPQNSVHSINEI